MEKVAIATENSRKIHLERNEYNEGDTVILSNWMPKFNIKKPYFKREKPKKETKHQRTEWYYIKGIVTKVKHQVWYVRRFEILMKEKTFKHNKK